MASVHVEAPPLSAHEAHLGLRQPEERRQPGEVLKSPTVSLDLEHNTALFTRRSNTPAQT